MYFLFSYQIELIFLNTNKKYSPFHYLVGYFNSRNDIKKKTNVLSHYFDFEYKLEKKNTKAWGIVKLNSMNKLQSSSSNSYFLPLSPPQNFSNSEFLFFTFPET